jgi:hypothetical protein
MTRRSIVLDRHGRIADIGEGGVPDGYSVRVAMPFMDSKQRAMEARFPTVHPRGPAPGSGFRG